MKKQRKSSYVRKWTEFQRVGRIGGLKSSARLSPEQLSERARKAAIARWDKLADHVCRYALSTGECGRKFKSPLKLDRHMAREHFRPKKKSKKNT